MRYISIYSVLKISLRGNKFCPEGGQGAVFLKSPNRVFCRIHKLIYLCKKSVSNMIGKLKVGFI